jgi:pyruvate/2-oxoglutarate dehydrogenase complex dihydrolipoamide acyltransferase (E2) component
MKMEHVHTAPISGTISAIDVTEGEQVTTGKIVVEIEAISPSFRGARSASPESILPIGVMDSGPAPSGASRNDDG